MDAGGFGLTPEQLFDGFPDSLRLYAAVQRAIDDIGEATVKVTKSQIAFRRRLGFAYIWRPGQYLANDVPAVLSIALPYRVVSDRFKAVAHPSARVWMHHVELRQTGQLDAEILGWLQQAYDRAG